ncbi:polysaccharide deacetylase family protein [Methanocella conradii]|nr:polysaccharide deacetylase family protein [Methanocella conradii]MDI6895976.1 polysaccharide deacetylase family protein [Methanocella conradii]
MPYRIYKIINIFVCDKMKNALSIDFEDCLCNEFLLKYIPKDIDKKKIEDQVIEATDLLLKLLDKYDTKATFFVLGKLANKYPEYIKMLDEAGHEIGSHGYSHTPLYDLGKDGFEKELKLSTELLKSITHKQPLGFRAPSFSINQSTSWAFELLEKYGYKYDSSVFPVKMILYGVPNAPLTPYRPNINDISKNDPDGKIIEYPLTVLKTIINIPISGGYYLRFFPKWFLDLSISRISKSRPVMIYVHPWETYKNTTKINAPLIYKFEAYYGIKNSLNKLEMLISKYKFEPIADQLKI